MEFSLIIDWLGREGGNLFKWWLLTTLAGAAIWPLLYRVMGGLPDRGYTLSRAAGLMLAGFIFWFLGVSAAWYTFRNYRVWRVVLPTDSVPAYSVDVDYGQGIVPSDDPYRFLPTLGELDLHLHYSVKRDGELVKEYERLQKRPFVGHPLPVTKLEPSDYSLEMKLIDRVSDQTLEQSVAFRIE